MGPIFVLFLITKIGTVLGPVLFLVFINDLDQGIASNILKFADDTKIFKEVMDKTNSEALQRDLDRGPLGSEMANGI